MSAPHSCTSLSANRAMPWAAAARSKGPAFNCATLPSPLPRPRSSSSIVPLSSRLSPTAACSAASSAKRPMLSRQSRPGGQSRPTPRRSSAAAAARSIAGCWPLRAASSSNSCNSPLLSGRLGRPFSPQASNAMTAISSSPRCTCALSSWNATPACFSMSSSEAAGERATGRVLDACRAGARQLLAGKAARRGGAGRLVLLCKAARAQRPSAAARPAPCPPASSDCSHGGQRTPPVPKPAQRWAFRQVRRQPCGPVGISWLAKSCAAAAMATAASANASQSCQSLRRSRRSRARAPKANHRRRRRLASHNGSEYERRLKPAWQAVCAAAAAVRQGARREGLGAASNEVGSVQHGRQPVATPQVWPQRTAVSSASTSRDAGRAARRRGRGKSMGRGTR
mmetsp:Transcript_107483/g.334062  ORF Transcript_107483/g.334062 Transcript_107483/m.334062 type:complete len:397 (+) Transcript_107483:977-2167(+)